LAGCVGWECSEHSFTESRVVDQTREFVGQIRVNVRAGVADFGDELFAAVDKGYDIAEIAAREKVFAAATVKRLELRRPTSSSTGSRAAAASSRSSTLTR
jgi:hypothetical protein